MTLNLYQVYLTNNFQSMGKILSADLKVINLKKKFEKIHKHWDPKIIARMNDYHFKIAKLQGDFVWHKHEETDEVFYIVKGKLSIEFRDGWKQLSEGDMLVVPKGTEHKPYADDECHLLMVETAGTLNTGDADGVRTVNDPEWI